MKYLFDKNITPLVIWGASGHARVLVDIIRLSGKYNIIGFLDDINKDKYGTQFCGAQIIGGQEQLRELHDNGVTHILFGFGDCQARLDKSILVKRYSFELGIAIHPSAILAEDVIVESGSAVMAGTVINSGSKIGENAIINTASSVDHDCEIQNGTHIGPGAHLGGGVSIGTGTWIGIGAVVKDKVKIGKNVIVGAGAVVLSDIPDGVVAYGIPAKVVRRAK